MDWIQLDERSSLGQLPATAGLYRVRAVDDALLAYVGQTGRSLRERVSALRGAFGREMPYRDPYTAAPARGVRFFKLASGQHLVVCWQPGYNGPPGEADVTALRRGINGGS